MIALSQQAGQYQTLKKCLLTRTHHSDTFGVMDLTAGYHQAPVSLGTRGILAFICFAEYSSSVIAVWT
jgi:hypothetical protein